MVTLGGQKSLKLISGAGNFYMCVTAIARAFQILYQKFRSSVWQRDKIVQRSTKFYEKNYRKHPTQNAFRSRTNLPTYTHVPLYVLNIVLKNQTASTYHQFKIIPNVQKSPTRKSSFSPLNFCYILGHNYLTRWIWKKSICMLTTNIYTYMIDLISMESEMGHEEHI